MELRSSSGVITFATHRINCDTSTLIGVIKQSQIKWNMTSYGFLVYSESEKNQVETYLTSNSISFTTTAIPPTQDQINEMTANIQGVGITRSQALRMLAASSAGVANLEPESTY